MSDYRFSHFGRSNATFPEREGTRERGAFTAIELLVVISIFIIVSAFTLPSITAAIRRGGVNSAADKLQQVINEAQVRARRQVATSPDPAQWDLYGVAIVPSGGGWYATLLRGKKSDAELLDPVTNQPVLRVPLHAKVCVGFGGGTPAPLTTTLAWLFLPGSGRPVQVPVGSTTYPRPVAVGTAAQAAVAADIQGEALYNWGTGVKEWGTRSLPLPAMPASPICSAISLRSHDERLRAEVAIYDLGLTVVAVRAVDASGAATDHGG